MTNQPDQLFEAIPELIYHKDHICCDDCNICKNDHKIGQKSLIDKCTDIIDSIIKIQSLSINQDLLINLSLEISSKLVKKKHIPKKLRGEVWIKWIGEDKISCLCPLCNQTIIKFFDTWHCGHVISEYRGGSVSLINLRAICSGCNTGMRTQNMIDYCEHYNGAFKRLYLDQIFFYDNFTNKDEFNEIIKMFIKCIKNNYINLYDNINIPLHINQDDYNRLLITMTIFEILRMSDKGLLILNYN